MIELKNVSKFYYQNGMIASGFNKVNLKLDIGEFVVITGESGSGKSTLLNVISGLDSYEEGEMYINGEETSHYTEIDFENYRRKYIGNIFQNFNLVNSYTVYQNIELVLLLNGEKKKNVKKKILDIISTVGLTKFKNTKVSKLSGGQKQRVAIARALAKETPVIVADEPTGNLDKKSAEQIMKLLHEISKNKLVVIVTHNKEQVEQYATRLIQMHDGKILEDKDLRKDKKEIKVETKKYKNITILNKIRLGIRNTFNIIPKFLLIFLVFTFISIALVFEYTSFKKQEADLEISGGNFIFTNNDPTRVILKKYDNSPITQEEIDKLSKLEHVKRVVTDDVFLDTYIELSEETNGYYIGGITSSINLFEGGVDYGRLPENENEIVIESSAYEWILMDNPKDVLDKEFYISMNYNEGKDEDLKVKLVGIKKPKSLTTDINTIYIPDRIINKLRFGVNERHSKIRVLFENKYHNSYTYSTEFKISPSDKVPEGNAYMSYDYSYLCKNDYCIKRPLKIEVSNIYYKDELNLTVTKMYTKRTFNNLTGYSDYENSNGIIYINRNEYNKLFNKDTYQSSIFVDNIKNLESVKETLNKDYKVLAIKDTLLDVNKDATIMMRVFSSVVTVILVIALFFISYFVIKLILKSRSIYFTTIRILGSTKRIAKQILDIELLTNATLSYAILVTFIYLNKLEILNIKQIKSLLPYINVIEIVVIYLVLISMAKLISNRFARKIFKNSAMKTYREEMK